MRTQPSVVIFTFFLFCFLNGSVFCAAPSPTVEAPCSIEFSEVDVCLSFATGKTDSPSKDCCTNIKDIMDKNPVCFCFVIQQAHDKSIRLKTRGLQKAKVLQLPSACNLANGSMSVCPKLLNLSPSSPDNAFFKDPSTVAPATSTPPTQSMGFMHRPVLASPIAITLATTMFICVPAGIQLHDDAKKLIFVVVLFHMISVLFGCVTQYKDCYYD
ncbi:hypothetical protein AQUCO_04000086v1 [Aquilegia coerulea]|uniref:Bifunctional inhibitor/plant lipid transfer protein/seed storage helical domain-containing protein n=1 Tax=Aquilegia coerulea TaxID=218851 RepID=A0A2G5CR57_AQUCA|nr:hypothetical protein AQUCO_04000086v1 [Aquilegia coerulea]